MSIPANGLRGKYAAARLLKPSPFMLGFYSAFWRASALRLLLMSLRICA